MPEKRTVKKAQVAKRQGKSPSTQAGASAKQAIAIGLSEARKLGVAIPDKSKKAETAKKTAAPKSRIVAKKVSPTNTVSHTALKSARTRTKHAR